MSVKLSRKSNIVNITLLRPSLCAISSALIAKVIEGSSADAEVTLFGVKLKFWMIYALLGFISALLSGSISDTVMNRLNARIQNLSKEVVNTGVHGALNVSILAVLDESHNIRPNALIIGILSSIVADYADTLVAPMMGSYRV